VKKDGYESQTQYIEVNNKQHQMNAQLVDFTLQSVSSEQIDLRRMLQQYMNKV